MLRNTRTRTQQAQQVRRTSPRNLQQQQPQQQQPQTKQLQPGQGNRALVKPRTQRRLTKVARVEANWNEAAFADMQSQQDAASKTGGSTKSWPRTLPEHSTATFVQLMLLHNTGWPSANIWQRWQAAHTEGSLAICSHLKRGVQLTPGMPGFSLISCTRLKASVDSRWGDISLVEATLQGLKEVLLRCPNAAHIGLASGHDVPVQLIQPGLLLPGVSYVGLFEFGAREMTALRTAVQEDLLESTSLTAAAAAAWRDALTFHHQWCVLAREHAAALVHHMRDILRIGRVLHGACRSVCADMAPDEFTLITALKQLGLVRSVHSVQLHPGLQYAPGVLLNCYPTSVVFPAESSPHPVLWTDWETQVLCQLEPTPGRQTNGLMSLKDCLQQAEVSRGIYFRKVHIRLTDTELQAQLLSHVEAMWTGQGHRGSNAVRHTPCGGSKAGHKKAGGGKRQRRGSGKGSGTGQKSKEPCGTTAVPPGVVLVTITKRQPSSKWQRSSKRLRRS